MDYDANREKWAGIDVFAGRVCGVSLQYENWIVATLMPDETYIEQAVLYCRNMMTEKIVGST